MVDGVYICKNRKFQSDIKAIILPIKGEPAVQKVGYLSAGHKPGDLRQRNACGSLGECLSLPYSELLIPGPVHKKSVDAIYGKRGYTALMNLGCVVKRAGEFRSNSG